MIHPDGTDDFCVCVCGGGGGGEEEGAHLDLVTIHGTTFDKVQQNGIGLQPCLTIYTITLVD